MTPALLHRPVRFFYFLLLSGLLATTAQLQAQDLAVTIDGQDVMCAGFPMGAAVANATGGTTPYTYLWSTGATTRAITSLMAGPYSVTVTDTEGDTAVANVVINEPDAPLEATIPQPIQCDEPFAISAVTTGGTVPYTYRWSTGESARTISVPTGSYCVTVIDNNLCGTVACVDVAPNQPTVAVVTTDVTCADDNDGTLTAAASEGTPPYQYAWSTGASGPTLVNQPAGTYTVTVTDSNGCTASASGTVSDADPITGRIIGDATVCPGVPDAFLRIAPMGGTGNYTYVWSFNGNTGQGIGPLGAGTYFVTVTDGNGCTLVDDFVITETPAVIIDGEVTDASCAGVSDGSITTTITGGVPAFRYNWSTGATTPGITGLAPGSYSVTVTDRDGCRSDSTFVVGQGAELSLSGAITSIDCSGDSTGAIDLTVVGGAPAGTTYEWSNGATTQDISGLAAGQYNVTVTAPSGCMATAGFFIVQPAPIDLTLTSTPVDCGGESTGSITVAATGGAGGFTYDWSNGATTPTITDLAAGTYVVTVTDANDCTALATATITEADPITGQIIGDATVCPGVADAFLRIAPVGGTPPYTYLWSFNSNTGQGIGPLGAGIYSVTVTDANGCTLVDDFTITETDAPGIAGVVTNASCAGVDNGSIATTVSGGIAPYRYDWSTGANTPSITNLMPGDYTVTVTDANGCQSAATFTVGQDDALELEATITSLTCNGDSSGIINLTVVGGAPAGTTYSWSNGATTQDLTGLDAGQYSVTVVGPSGCATTAIYTVTEPAPITVTVSVNDIDCGGDSTGSIDVAASGGTAPYVYTINGIATTLPITDLSAGTYTLSVTDANGCSETSVVTVNEAPALICEVVVTQEIDGDDNGELRVDVTGGMAPFAYTWSDGGAMSNVRTDLSAGTYTVTVTDANGCETVCSATLRAFEPNPIIDIEEECSCLSNQLGDDDGQFRQTVVVTAAPGQSWTVVSSQNAFVDAGAGPPTVPQVLPNGTVLTESAAPGQPNLSLYILPVRVVDGQAFTITVGNGVTQLSVTNQCDYPEIVFINPPTGTFCTAGDPDPVPLNATVTVNGAPASGTVTFTVNGNPATVFAPATSPTGTISIVATYTPDDVDSCSVSIETQVEVTDDCPAKLGDFVWEDLNGNGQQDIGEPGIEGVTATVTSQDGTYMDVTTTDETGMYMFFVPPGTYKVTFSQPDELMVTTANSGDDATDSDVDPNTLMTGFYTVGPNEMDLTIDAGFVNPCIDNVDDPGEIGFDQTICGPGNVPDELVEIAPATGGVGPLEYLWMYVRVSAPATSPYIPIPNTNSPNYQPGPIFEDTYFIRCVRRANCQFIETDRVRVSVGDQASGNVSAPRTLCVNESGTFTATGVQVGSQVRWSFAGPAASTLLSGRTVTNSWSAAGTYNGSLIITRGGCESRRPFRVSVTANPSRCGGSLEAIGATVNVQAREVTIEWSVPTDEAGYTFVLERSMNGRDFEPAMADITSPMFENEERMWFRQSDQSPRAGRTFYRVRLVDAEFGDLISNVVEMDLTVAATSLGQVYPNPSRNGRVEVQLTNWVETDEEVTIRLYDTNGKLVGNPRHGVGSDVSLSLDTQGRPAGIYLLEVRAGNRREVHRVVVR